MLIYVDIDGTICRTEGRGYEEAAPMFDKIAKVNRYYDEGNTIIYWTARGALTGVDWREVTEKQLKEWGAKYHELKFDKPFYDVLIDDKTRSDI